jgi:hypothetical protein
MKIKSDIRASHVPEGGSATELSVAGNSQRARGDAFENDPSGVRRDGQY